MILFSEWINIKETTSEISGLSTQDFTALSQDERMRQGRDVGEPFIKQQLKSHGLNIEPVPTQLDISQKIDGKLNGEFIQIKLRRSSLDDRNDMAYELVRNHQKDIPIDVQLDNPRNQGRDFKGKVRKYFVMNKAETEIYEIPYDKIQKEINNALDQLNNQRNGLLFKPFTAENGIQIRPTTDKDPESFTKQKVMAFIPIPLVIDKSYPINPNLKPKTNTPFSPTRQNIPQDRPEFLEKLKLIQNGPTTFPIGSTNNKKRLEKINDAKKFANKNNINVTIDDKNNTITFYNK